MPEQTLVEKYISAFQFPIHKAYMHEKLGRYAPWFTGELLDIGAGDAPYKQLFTQAGKYVTTNSRQHYGHKITQVESNTDYWVEDAKNLDFEDSRFDGVLCFQVLSVIPEPQDFFREISRVLKPGGKFCITTDFLYPSWSKEDQGRYSVETLQKWCNEAGLKYMHAESFGGYKSLQYSIYNRWIRDLRTLFRQEKNTLRKLFYFFDFAAGMMIMPWQYIRGWWIFQQEKGIHDQPGNSFNLLLLGEKPAEKTA